MGLFSHLRDPNAARTRLLFGGFFVAALSLRKSARFKFRRKSFGRFAELALFSEGDDRTDYVDDNELGDARGDGLGGSWCPPHRRYQDSV
jgi:hypothetical protein